MKTFSHRLAALACALCSLLHTTHAWAQDWPAMPLPKGVQTFDIAQQITINGLPMRIRGFLSPLKPQRIAQEMRESWGAPVVESTLGKQLILGQLRGDYYHSVQLEAAGTGTRGVLAATHLKAAFDAKDQTKIDSEKWLSRLPSGSRLVSRMVSKDGSRYSSHLVIENSYSESQNSDAIKKLLSEDGFSLQHEKSLAATSSPKLPANTESAKTFYFKGAGKEAMATQLHSYTGLTTVVLNIITDTQ